MLQGALQVGDNVAADYARLGEVVRVLQGLILQPEDVQARLVAADDFLVGIGTPAARWIVLAPARSALMAVGRIVEGDELVQVRTLERVGLEGEMHVGAQVIDPELLGPRLFAGRLLVEEDDVRLDPLGVEQAGGEAQQGVHVAFMQELLADGLTCSALEEHVVRHHYGGPAMLFEQGFDVLDEVELLVGGGGPEVLTFDGLLLSVGPAIFADDGG